MKKKKYIYICTQQTLKYRADNGKRRIQGGMLARRESSIVPIPLRNKVPILAQLALNRYWANMEIFRFYNTGIVMNGDQILGRYMNYSIFTTLE